MPKQLHHIFLYLKQSLSNGAICYLLAILVLIPVSYKPQMQLTSLVQDTLFIVDISESMAVRDVSYPKPRSARLTLAKQAVIETMASLPCGSIVSFGLTAGEESVLLFEPLEVCRHFPAIEKVVSKIDTRARWIGDSKTTDITIKAIKQAQERELNLVILTDGDEMPRRSSLHMRSLAKYRGYVNGILLGIGGDKLQPIPKFNAQGDIVDYWSRVDALAHGNYPGLVAHAHALKRGEPIPEGALDGVTEHLSRFNKTIMESISKVSGLPLHRINTPDDAVNALKQTQFQRHALADRDARWIFALLAIAFLLFGWFWQTLLHFTKSMLTKF